MAEVRLMTVVEVVGAEIGLRGGAVVCSAVVCWERSAEAALKPAGE